VPECCLEKVEIRLILEEVVGFVDREFDVSLGVFRLLVDRRQQQLHQERLAIDPRRAALDLTEVNIDDFAIALEDIDLGVVRKILVGATLTEWLERNRKFICILGSTLASRLDSAILCSSGFSAISQRIRWTSCIVGEFADVCVETSFSTIPACR